MPENILVIVVDGLRASALGAYGNTSFPTPALDRLAVRSLLFDWCFAPSSDLTTIYDAMWRSQEEKQNSPAIVLPHCLATAGYQTTVITDDSSLCAFPLIEKFDEVVRLKAPDSDSGNSRVRNFALTNLAHTFSAATDAVNDPQCDRPQMIWLHTRGMYGTWDAPLELQYTLLDEDDPDPTESSTPPDLKIDTNDPDTAFRYACAYAAQVMVLDECLEGLLHAVDQSNNNKWLISLIGARGFPLGEHGRIGGVDPRTYAEQMHVPWMLSIPNSAHAMARSNGLTSHVDLLPTIVDWLGQGQDLERSGFQSASVLPWATSYQPTWREAIVSRSSIARSVRTSTWCLREQRMQSGCDVFNEAVDTIELFVRPDDRWEANDVAKLCLNVVDELRAELPPC